VWNHCIEGPGAGNSHIGVVISIGQVAASILWQWLGCALCVPFWESFPKRLLISCF